MPARITCTSLHKSVKSGRGGYDVAGGPRRGRPRQWRSSGVEVVGDGAKHRSYLAGRATVGMATAPVGVRDAVE